MKGPKLTVIRCAPLRAKGEKDKHQSDLALWWKSMVPMPRKDKPPLGDVIPLMEGWIRLLEKQTEPPEEPPTSSPA